MSETARMLDDAAHRILSRSLADQQRFAEPEIVDEILDELEKSGLALVMAAEVDGGLGGGLLEATTLAWRLGWHATPVPIVPLLLCPLLVGGTPLSRLRTTLATDNRLRFSGGKLIGDRIEAPATSATKTILIVCTGDGGSSVVEVAADDTERFHTIDGQLYLSLDAAKAQIIEARQSPIEVERLAAYGALITTAVMTGAMARQLDIVTDHVNTRTQFGRPLSKFQAVQNMIANAASEYTVTQAALAGAVEAEDGGWGRAIYWQSAKAQAGRAATIVSAVAHQALGAIGFTEEHFLHRLSKKLWMMRDDWGRESALERAVGEAACADVRGLWPHLVDGAFEGRT
jgi:acyl-CoA dehydrogenase